jgi:type IV pilus assembly protein PilO
MAATAKSATNAGVSPARGLGAQFRGLQFRDMWAWPTIPKFILYVVVVAVVLGLAYFFVLRDAENDWDAKIAQEEKLKTEYKSKVQRAVSLTLLKEQREKVLQYVTQLEKQLPSKSEMDALLSDMNAAGLGRSLQFQLFRPQPLVIRDYYAELPITLKVTGRYHDIGAFAADVAGLSRIVTLNNVTISQPAANNTSNKSMAPGALVMDAVAKTFRYLNPDDPEDRAALDLAKGKNKKQPARR